MRIYPYTDCWWQISQNTDSSLLVSFVLHLVFCADMPASRSQGKSINVSDQSDAPYQKPLQLHIILWHGFWKKDNKWFASHSLRLLWHKEHGVKQFHFVSNFCLSWIIKCGAAVTQQTGIRNQCSEESHLKKMKWRSAPNEMLAQRRDEGWEVKAAEQNWVCDTVWRGWCIGSTFCSLSALYSLVRV